MSSRCGEPRFSSKPMGCSASRRDGTITLRDGGACASRGFGDLSQASRSLLRMDSGRRDGMAERRRAEITTRINRQGAMLDEVRRLLPMLDPTDVRGTLRQLVVGEDLFRRSSLASREQLFSNLGIRYFRADTPKANANFVRAARVTMDESEVGLLAYVMLLWNDGLIHFLAQTWFAPVCEGAEPLVPYG